MCFRGRSTAPTGYQSGQERSESRAPHAGATVSDVLTVAAATPSLDITYVVDRLAVGAIHRPIDVVRCPGGKALNLARAAHTLDAEVRLVGLFGGGTGRWLVDELTSAGIGVRAVESGVETRTCISIADTKTGELTELYPYADSPTAAAWSAFCDTSAALAAAPRSVPGWFAMSGGAPSGLADDAIAAVLAAARDAGLRIAVDTHGPALAAAVAIQPDLVKINRSEAAGLLDAAEDTPLVQLAIGVQERSGGLVVITDGADGALGLPSPDDAGPAWQVPVPGRRGSFPVGSGDSFLGGLLASLDRGEPLPDALMWATACGTANALVPGAAVFTAEAATALYAQAHAEPAARS